MDIAQKLAQKDYDKKVLNVRLRKEIYWEHLGMMDDLDISGG